MNKTILALAAAVLLGVTQASAATLPARQPGMWQSTTYVTLADGTKARNGLPVVTVSCVDPATDLKFFTIGGSKCSHLAISGAGSHYQIDSTCTQAGKPVTVSEILIYQDAQTVALNGSVDNGTGPITLQAELKFIGDCVPGMIPGDEGSLDNGSFTKTDNINDFDNQ